MMPLDLIVIGAGPSGLAAAIAARRHALSCRVFEKGALVNSILNFPTQMVFFTTPELLEVGGLPFVTPYEKPTRSEALRYYRRVVDTFRLDVSLEHPVTAVTPLSAASDGARFAVTVRTREQGVDVYRAQAVLFAQGAFDRPNRLGVPGEDLPHVSHYYREAHPYFRQSVVIVGGKNSAAEAALELYRSGARVTLVHRRPELGASIKYWVRPDIENRIQEGSIAARFETCVVEIRPRSVVVERAGVREEIGGDAVLLLTGYLPDVRLLREAGVAVDPASLIPSFDPETFETNVPGLFVAGSIVAGRESGRVFIENGRFHGAQIVRVLAERLTRTESVLSPVPGPLGRDDLDFE